MKIKIIMVLIIFSFKLNAQNQSSQISKKQYEKLIGETKITKLNDTSFIKKIGNKISVELITGKSIVLEDIQSSKNETQNIKYDYKGCIDKNRKFLVFIVERYESGDYLVINSETGDKMVFWDMPKINPSRTRVATFSDLGKDIENEKMGYQIGNLVTNKISETNSKIWYPENLSWIKDNLIVLKARNLSSKKVFYLKIFIRG